MKLSKQKIKKNEATPTKTENTKSMQILTQSLDVNKDGVFDIEDIITICLRAPGAYVDREGFLRKELSRKYPENVVSKAIDSTPLEANVLQQDIDQIADNIIKYEQRCATGFSAICSFAITMPADLAQYYLFLIRAIQKLMYLYGFPQIEANDEHLEIDTSTINIITICLGITLGMDSAVLMINRIATSLAKETGKRILKTALTKTTWYPIMKKITKMMGVKITKNMLAFLSKSAIIGIGAVVNGTITYASFKSSCDNLKNALKDTALSNPNYVYSESDVALSNIDNLELE